MRLYKVVPISTKTVSVTVVAETDFDALDQAKQFLGADVPFQLWDGDRLALTYRPKLQSHRANTAG